MSLIDTDFYFCCTHNSQVSFSRQFDTGDADDVKLSKHETIHLIWAVREDGEWGKHDFSGFYSLQPPPSQTKMIFSSSQVSSSPPSSGNSDPSSSADGSETSSSQAKEHSPSDVSVLSVNVGDHGFSKLLPDAAEPVIGLGMTPLNQDNTDSKEIMLNFKFREGSWTSIAFTSRVTSPRMTGSVHSYVYNVSLSTLIYKVGYVPGPDFN